MTNLYLYDVEEILQHLYNFQYYVWIYFYLLFLFICLYEAPTSNNNYIYISFTQPITMFLKCFMLYFDCTRTVNNAVLLMHPLRTQYCFHCTASSTCSTLLYPKSTQNCTLFNQYLDKFFLYKKGFYLNKLYQSFNSLLIYYPYKCTLIHNWPVLTVQLYDFYVHQYLQYPMFLILLFRKFFQIQRLVPLDWYFSLFLMART